MDSTKKKRILEISKKLGLAHIGSCLSCLPVLQEIYDKKKPGDIVLLDNAHAHLAHVMFTTSEDMQEEIIKIYGIHCDRDGYCDASGGSLGHALGIGIGYAIAYPNHSVYVIVSDGSMMEGSNWEALRIRQQLKLTNLKIYTVFNGHSAVAPIDGNDLMFKMENFSLGVGDIYYYFTDEEKCNSIEWHYKKL